MRLLLDTIANGSGDLKLDKYFKARHLHIEQKTVTFETLWTIFPCGALVFGRPFLGQDQVFIVQDNLRPWPWVSRRNKAWSLRCWAYDWDGKLFKRKAVRLEIEPFDSSKAITTLPYYPLKFHGRYEELKKDLIVRGKRYRERCTVKQGSRMFDYSGEVLFSKMGAFKPSERRGSGELSLSRVFYTLMCAK